MIVCAVCLVLGAACCVFALRVLAILIAARLRLSSVCLLVCYVCSFCLLCCCLCVFVLAASCCCLLVSLFDVVFDVRGFSIYINKYVCVDWCFCSMMSCD